MSKRLNVYKDQKLIYDIVMEPSFDKLQEEVSKFHLEEHKHKPLNCSNRYSSVVFG